MNATKTYKLVSITRNGFHGLTTVRFRPIGEGTDPMSGEPAWLVSLRTARRLNASVCGCSDCRCGEQVAEVDDGYNSGVPYGCVPQTDEIRGFYPQR